MSNWLVGNVTMKFRIQWAESQPSLMHAAYAFHATRPRRRSAALILRKPSAGKLRMLVCLGLSQQSETADFRSQKSLNVSRVRIFRRVSFINRGSTVMETTLRNAALRVTGPRNALHRSTALRFSPLIPATQRFPPHRYTLLRSASFRDATQYHSTRCMAAHLHSTQRKGNKCLKS